MYSGLYGSAAEDYVAGTPEEEAQRDAWLRASASSAKLSALGPAAGPQVQPQNRMYEGMYGSMPEYDPQTKNLYRRMADLAAKLGPAAGPQVQPQNRMYEGMYGSMPGYDPKTKNAYRSMADLSAGRTSAPGTDEMYYNAERIDPANVKVVPNAKVAAGRGNSGASGASAVSGSTGNGGLWYSGTFNPGVVNNPSAGQGAYRAPENSNTPFSGIGGKVNWGPPANAPDDQMYRDAIGSPASRFEGASQDEMYRDIVGLPS
jgi:hypothetical protein